MKNTNFNYSDSYMRVCVDRLFDKRIAGRVMSRRLREPIVFSDLNDFIIKVESVLDFQNYPQSFQKKRIFKRGENVGSQYISGDGKMLGKEEVSEARGEIGTFTIQIRSRRNTSWQGDIDWLDGSPRQKFESDLQFVGLLGEYIGKLSDKLA